MKSNGHQFSLVCLLHAVWTLVAAPVEPFRDAFFVEEVVAWEKAVRVGSQAKAAFGFLLCLDETSFTPVYCPWPFF